MRLAVLSARIMARFSSCCRSTADSSSHSSSFTANAHARRTGSTSSRVQRIRFVDSEEIARRLATGGIDGKPGGRTARRAAGVSSQRGRPRRAWKSALGSKACLLAKHKRLRMIVASKLILTGRRSRFPGWLKRRYPSNESMRVSHETIYRSLFIQARGVLEKELMQHLRSKRAYPPLPYARKLQSSPEGQIVDAISIRERPAEIEDPRHPLVRLGGGDLLSGTGEQSHLQPLVERHLRPPSWSKCPGKDTATVVDALDPGRFVNHPGPAEALVGPGIEAWRWPNIRELHRGHGR